MTTVDPSATVGGVTYRVSPEYLANAATSTDTTATEIAALLDGIRTYVYSLESSWQGVAAMQFQTLMASYDNYAQRLNQALTGIAGGLRGTYANYTESEQENLTNLQLVNLPSPANFE